MITTILEVSREADLASKFSEEMPYAIGFATPFWCQSPRRASESATQSNNADLRSLAEAALPNFFWA